VDHNVGDKLFGMYVERFAKGCTDRQLALVASIIAGECVHRTGVEVVGDLLWLIEERLNERDAIEFDIPGPRE
jgi:hypothetical protein